MTRSFKTKTAVIAAVGVLGFGGVAVAATVSSDAPTPLTGKITDQASKAALAKYPGATLVGLRSAPDGTYLAELRTTDGTMVGVELDKAFKVTDTHSGRFGGPGGPGHDRFRLDTAALAKSLGVTEEQLRAAFEATRKANDDPKDDHVAAIAKALGASTADVESVLEAQRGDRPDGDDDDHPDRTDRNDRGDRHAPDERPGPGGPGGPGGLRGFGGPGGPGPRGDSDLVSALAKKTGKSEDVVTKALESARTARQDAQAAALAKRLGVDVEKLEAALDAAKPDRPSDRP